MQSVFTPRVGITDATEIFEVTTQKATNDLHIFNVVRDHACNVGMMRKVTTTMIIRYTYDDYVG